VAFTLKLTREAEEQLAQLDRSDRKKARKVRKTLGYLETNPRHPGLRTHKYDTLSGTAGFEVFEAYVENQTPGAYRVFFSYGPGENQITVLAITSHP
jgi:mRNA-degrading endonuclease RelE of RelBE toxin-antitoxin system